MPGAPAPAPPAPARWPPRGTTADAGHAIGQPTHGQGLEAILSPFPKGDLMDQATAYVRRFHGEGYGDPEAIRLELGWLVANGFSKEAPESR
jgi:hypothetical protein